MRGGAREREEERKAKTDIHSPSEKMCGRPLEYRCGSRLAERVLVHEDVRDH